MSELTDLAFAVRALGESCSKLSDMRYGALVSLREAESTLSAYSDIADIAPSVHSAGVLWGEIEADVKGAALAARKFGSSLVK